THHWLFISPPRYTQPVPTQERTKGFSPSFLPTLCPTPPVHPLTRRNLLVDNANEGKILSLSPSSSFPPSLFPFHLPSSFLPFFPSFLLPPPPSLFPLPPSPEPVSLCSGPSLHSFPGNCCPLLPCFASFS
ncbi:hypothetical protein LEMLEM_LOCUS15156, partial [Lemmus lemmus]